MGCTTEWEEHRVEPNLRSSAYAYSVCINKSSSTLESCLILIRDGPETEVVIRSDNPGYAVFDKNANGLCYLLEKHLVKIIYSIMLKLQMMVSILVRREIGF